MRVREGRGKQEGEARRELPGSVTFRGPGGSRGVAARPKPDPQ